MLSQSPLLIHRSDGSFDSRTINRLNPLRGYRAGTLRKIRTSLIAGAQPPEIKVLFLTATPYDPKRTLSAVLETVVLPLNYQDKWRSVRELNPCLPIDSRI